MEAVFNIYGILKVFMRTLSMIYETLIIKYDRSLISQKRIQKIKPFDGWFWHGLELEPVNDKSDFAAFFGTLTSQWEPPVDEVLFGIDDFFYRNWSQ